MLGQRDDTAVLQAISAAVLAVYDGRYATELTRASTYVTGQLVVCVLEDVQGDGDSSRDDREIEAERRAFQHAHEDEFRDAVEALTGCRVVWFMSANRVSSGVAAELFFCDRPLV